MTERLKTDKVPLLLQKSIPFTHVFMWNDMWDVLQQQLGSFLAFLQLLEQQAGLQVPEGEVRFECEQKADVFTVSTAIPCLYSLAQPVLIGGEATPTVPFIKHHQPAMNTVEQLQFFTLSVF